MVQGRAALLVISAVGWLLLTMGVWRLTTPLRSAHTLRTPMVVARLFRLTTALTAACWIALSAFYVALLSGTSTTQTPSVTPTVAFGLQGAASLVTIACAVVGLLHAKSLMRRGIRRGRRGGGVATSALVVLVVAVGLTLAIGIFGGLALLSNPGPQGAFGLMSGVVALVAGLAWFTVYISLIGVSERLRLLIRNERRIGERAREDAPASQPTAPEVHA